MNTLDPAALRLAAIVESSDDAILSHTLDGTIETWNRAAERIFGYSPAEAVGRSVDLLVPPEGLEEERQIIRRIRDGEVISHLETVALLKDGRRLPVAISVSPVLTAEGHMIGIARIARDISAQNELERDVFRLAAIVDSSEDAIVSKDLNGIVRTWNRAAERMFGYTADEIVGQSILLIIPPDRVAEEEQVLSRIRSGLPVEHFETIRRHKSGAPIEISLSVSPIKTRKGAVIGASKIARDITQQRQLARQAEEANRVKDEFLATLSHELRTPLNAVLGYTRMLRRGQFDGERRDGAIDVIERNAAVLHQLVSDVLDVSAIVTGKMRVTPRPCDLAVLLQAACDSVRATSEAKGVPLRIDIPGEPVPAVCDSDRMQQVFWNLLSNAVKFTPRGGHVDVRLSRNGHFADVTVRDTGVGIQRDALPHIFQRFWQGESVNSRLTGGLGLGLALARHFVEMHGGTITAASEGPGKGATFTVTLPMQERP